MSEPCGNANPNDPSMTCSKPKAGCRNEHVAVEHGQVLGKWPNSFTTDVLAVKKKPSTKKMLAMAGAAKPETRAGGYVPEPHKATAEFGQQEAERAYGATDDAWKRQATDIVMHLRDSGREFSGNDVWEAGLPVPQNEHGRDERRAIGHVFTRLGREGYIKNTGKTVTSLYGHGSQIAVWINADL